MKIKDWGKFDRPFVHEPGQPCRIMPDETTVYEFCTPIRGLVTHWAELDDDRLIIGDDSILESMTCSVRKPYEQPGPP